MIMLANMRPGRAASGRRYFRGSDKRGNVFWLMEQPPDRTGEVGWLLRVDAGGSMAREADVGDRVIGRGAPMIEANSTDGERE